MQIPPFLSLMWNITILPPPHLEDLVQNAFPPSGVTRHPEMGDTRFVGGGAPIVVYYMFFQYCRFYM